MAAIKIKSTHVESQGPYVIIEQADFDAARHEIYVEPEAAKPGDPNDLSAKTVKELQAIAAERGIDLGEATKKADIIAAIEAAKPGE